MRLYHVDDDYIEYLRQFDSRVYDNKNGTRPYVGVALTVAGTEYYIPMSSPKEALKKAMSGSRSLVRETHKWG